MIESDRVREQAVQKNYVYVVLSRHAAWRDIIGVQCVGGVAFRGAVATPPLGARVLEYLPGVCLSFVGGWSKCGSRAYGEYITTNRL